MKINDDKKRRRATALQTLPAIAKRLGVRQSSGAFGPSAGRGKFTLGTETVITSPSPPRTCGGEGRGEEVRSRPSCLRKDGFTLIECLVYIGLLAVVLGFAMQIFFHCWDDNKALRRNAEDIVRALRAGDQWRADVRAASGTVQLTAANGAEQLHIPSSSGDIIYTFSDGKIRRQTGSLDEVWLPAVASSQMKADARQNVPAWKWELELKPSRKESRMHPLFTFEAVAGGVSKL